MTTSRASRLTYTVNGISDIGPIGDGRIATCPGAGDRNRLPPIFAELSDFAVEPSISKHPNLINRQRLSKTQDRHNPNR